MNSRRDIEAYSFVIDTIHNLAYSVGSIEAIGLSGSHARGNEDALSDIDICVYVASEIPSLQMRQQGYAQLGFTDFLYLDVDFDYSRGDGFLIRGTRCDFNWMSILTIQSFLQRLVTDFELPEYIPGGLALVKALHDPGKIISNLQAAIPKYSDARAKHRITKAFHEAHFSLYDLGWLEKAAFRNDCFLFLKYKYNLLDSLFQILFSLNQVWLSDEKGLLKQVAGFAFAPEQIELRLQSIILHQQKDRELHYCLASLKKLFAETLDATQRKYPDLELSFEWT